MLELSLIQKIVVWIIPLLSAITLHEAAHAYVANYFGDTTAKQLGRLSMNPFKHVDLVGTILVPIVVAILSQFQFVFGWAKPVPLDWSRLRNPKRDVALVAFAGPLLNLIMAFLWAFCMKMAILMNPRVSTVALFLLLMSHAGIMINLVLGILNLVPIPPLDGSRIIMSFLSPKSAIFYAKIEPFGYLILFALLFTGLLGLIITPFIQVMFAFISLIFNI